jgi:hypothetical protein
MSPEASLHIIVDYMYTILIGELQEVENPQMSPSYIQEAWNDATHLVVVFLELV